MEPQLSELEIEFVKNILDEDPKYGHVDSNVSFVCDATGASGARGEQITESLVRRCISNVSSKLAANAEYEMAFREFFGRCINETALASHRHPLVLPALSYRWRLA